MNRPSLDLICFRQVEVFMKNRTEWKSSGVIYIILSTLESVYYSLEYIGWFHEEFLGCMMDGFMKNFWDVW